MTMRKSGLVLVVALLTWARHCCGAEQDQRQWRLNHHGLDTFRST